MLTSRFFPSFVVASSLLLLPAVLPAKDRITIFYDAFSDSKEITKDWGFSALIEHDGKRLLFDTGNDAATFEHNTRAVGIDLTKLAFVVISHRHTDHTTGLKYLLSINPNVPVYAPMEAFCMFGGSVPPTLIKPVASLPDRMRYYGEVSGQDRFRISLERRELSLVLRGADGLSLVVGCSHPGIEEILQAASAIDTHLHFLCGGLHLVTTPEPEIDRLADNLKNKWKMEKIAPEHCTASAFSRLQKVFGDDYLYAGVGTRLEVP